MKYGNSGVIPFVMDSAALNINCENCGDIFSCINIGTITGDIIVHFDIDVGINIFAIAIITIDIINNGISFNDVLKNHIFGNGGVLKLMYDHGVSAFIETSLDDMGTQSKHIHIGTDNEHQDDFWDTEEMYYDNNPIQHAGGQFTIDNYQAYNYRTAEIQLQNTVLFLK